MNPNEHKTVNRRMALLIALSTVVIALYVLRLVFLQLINDEYFRAQATSTTDYNVVLSKLLMGEKDLNETLQQVVEILKANGESWNDTLLISEPGAAGQYHFTNDPESESDQNTLASTKEALGLQQYATAQDVMGKLVEDYELGDWPLYWQRVLGGLHYQMQQEDYSNLNNFTLAEGVSDATVATIKEHSLELPGVEIVQTSAG
mgnify:CR=1 FL=1